MTNRMKFIFLITMLIITGTPGSGAEKGGPHKLWYDKPAKVWNEALPVGNGRLGAMIYGDPVNEKIQLNEETFWSGGPSRNDNPNALKALPGIRQLIFDGKLREAEKLVNENMLTELHGSKYQVVGNLNLNFEGHENYTNYYRELDIENAMFTTTYVVDGVTFRREVLASQPDKVIVVKLTASEPGKLSFTAGMDGALQKSVRTLDNKTIELTGLSSDHEGVTGQVRFNALSRLVNRGGNSVADGNVIKVTGASEVLIFISIATNFVDYNTLTADEAKKAMAFLTAAEKKSYETLKSDHIAAYQQYYNRVSLDLGTSPAAQLPTDIRIRDFAKGHDPELVSMYFQFGRYLLISSSQPGGQPANLQGIWNESTSPAWDSKYTININTEMNYWPAEKCNLPEMHEPLFRMVRELSESGRQTAKTMYGARGWVVHHNTDIWRISGVVDGAFWGMWPMGGAWLSQHLWERYLYSGDMKFLEEVYPIFKSACEFYQDFLIEEPTHQWLVVSPSISPENAPAGKPSVCAGATMDNQILFDLFTHTIKAARLLNKDQAFAGEIQKLLDRLPPMQIGQHGQLQEWMEDLDNPDDKHRHVSHLYGLHPSNQISAYSSPELFDAARTTLIHRGDVSTGWSMGWKVNFWARLLDGNHAMKLIRDQLTLVNPVRSGNNGGTYPNFFDAHPPFQIDGNFGCTAGIAEMLMQAHDGAIHFLPALPDEWSDGKITGLRTPGGFEVSFEWKNHKVTRVEIKSILGGNCRIRVPDELKLQDGKSLAAASGKNPNPFFDTPAIKKPIVSESATLNPVVLKPSMLYDFPTEAGKTYILSVN
jgi:alpha-L-fucosidase 2